MGRQNTIGFGSGMGPSSPGPGLVSNKTEADWFAPTNPTLQPIGHELGERRGWRPPPPTKGLGFAVVSVVLVAVAAGGALFFFGPEANPPRSSSSTTTVTNADLAPTATPVPATTPVPAPMPTITPADLPPARHPGAPLAAVPPGVSQLTSATAAAAAPAPAKPRVSQLTSAKPPPKRAPYPARSPRPNDRSLPDLDRAAAAAGATPQENDPFATPGNEVKAPISATPSSEAPTPAPAPSDVLPDLQIKR